jgi:hypothetical protein
VVNINLDRIIFKFSFAFLVAALLTTTLFSPFTSIHAQELRSKGLNSEIVNNLESQYVAKLSSPTIGVEVEGVIPKEIGLKGMFEVLSKELKLEFPKLNMNSRDLIDVIRTGEERLIKEISYATSSPTAKYGGRAVWRVREDGSIKPPTGYEGAEINSPIMRTIDDKNRFYRILNSWVESGLRAEKSSAGIHVHVGFQKAHLSEILLLVKAFSLIEVELIDFFEVEKSRRHFAEITPESLLEELEKINEKASSDINPNELKDLSRDTERYKEFIEKHYDYKYWALNLKSLFSFGTVEFRIWNSTMDIAEIKTMIEFASGLVHGIRSKNPKLLEFIKNPPKKGRALSGLINTLNMPKMGKKRCQGFLLGNS